MNNLSIIREARGLSQRDLAEMTGLSQPTIQRAESEHKTAKLATYRICADILGVTLGAIFGDWSDVEQELISLFRSIPDHKYPDVMQILKLATSEAPESS